MGTFSKIGEERSVKQKNDDVLLLHAMLLMAGADGTLERRELATVEAFLSTLPEFQDKDFGALIEHANKVISRYGGDLEESVNSLREIESVAVRQKCFLLAADVAMSSGDVNEPEERMLALMQEVLDIDDAVADRILEVLALKYAQ